MKQGGAARGDHTELGRRTAANLVRGLFAYLALTPVIVCWGLLLIVLFVITLASFEAQTADATTAVFTVLSELTARFPFLEYSALDSPAVKDTGVVEINNDNLLEVIFGLYGYLALPFVILGTLLDLVRGPRPPRSLSRKIKILGLATLAVIAALFISFLLGSETWSGGALAWSLMFIIGPGIVWLISAVSLSLHHFIAGLDMESDG